MSRKEVPVDLIMFLTLLKEKSIELNIEEIRVKFNYTKETIRKYFLLVNNNFENVKEKLKEVEIVKKI